MFVFGGNHLQGVQLYLGSTHQNGSCPFLFPFKTQNKSIFQERHPHVVGFKGRSEVNQPFAWGVSTILFDVKMIWTRGFPLGVLFRIWDVCAVKVHVASPTHLDLSCPSLRQRTGTVPSKFTNVYQQMVEFQANVGVFRE